MVETWLLELAKGIGRLFLNPLFYWTIILVLLAGYKRIKKERRDFGVKVFDVFTEWKRTWIPAIISGLIISVAIIGAGVVFSYGTLLILSIIMVILSLNLRFTLLSASYTVGLTYIVLLFLPSILENQRFIDQELFTETNFVGLMLLLGVMLLVEGFFIQRVRRNESFPNLVLSERGIWIGHHRLKKMSIIPLFLLVPGGMIESFAPYWPLISIGENSYGIVLFPFLLGFNHIARSKLVPIAARQLGKQILLLGVLVIAVSVGGFYFNGFGLSLAALIIAIFGREFITYRYRMKDKKKNPYFQPHAKGIQVLGIIPGTPAERLEIQIGEVIAKVNDKRISSPDEFYEALRSTGAYFKLDILDDRNEVRFVQGALYEDDHYKLGLIFMKEPYRMKKKSG